MEVGVKESFKKKLVRHRLKWAGHVERMGESEKGIADAQKMDGKTRCGRPKLRITVKSPLTIGIPRKDLQQNVICA